MIRRTACIGVLAWIGAVLAGCSPDEGPQTGSQTNWLRACSTSTECGSEACHCGLCTRSCEVDATCRDGLTCVAADDPGAMALCGGVQTLSSGLCLARCGNDVCAAGQACVAGVCRPLAAINAHIAVTPEQQYQQLVGFGATLAYAEAEVAQFPNQSQLFQTMFADLGLDILRLRNHFGYVGDDSLASARAIVGAATGSLGRRPTIILASWSPPAGLKSNGGTMCRGEEDNCTLLRSAQGGFDYASYAEYWRASVDAYSAAGVSADYIAIQNNPDFVPSALEPGEGCRFLPTEGKALVATSSGMRTLEFPGYAQALAAVLGRFDDPSQRPKIIAPEVSTPDFVAKYVSSLGENHIDAIGHHLYGSAPTSPNVAAMRELNQLGETIGRPVFQTEMRADGLGTAVLLHHTLVTEGAAAYLHDALVGPLTSEAAGAKPLIALGADRYWTQLPYHALRHYASHTDPTWVRVGAQSDREDLLATAWLSPASDQLTIVLVNSGTDILEVELGLATAASTQVIRTTFDGDERSADLGALPEPRTVQLPAHSMATVVVKR